MGWITENGEHILIADADVEINYYKGTLCKLGLESEEYSRVSHEIHNWYKARFLTRVTKTKSYNKAKPEKYCSITLASTNCTYFFRNFGYDDFIIVGRLQLGSKKSYEVEQTAKKIMNIIEKRGGKI